MLKPNLFEFATSELSQDAVLAWTLSWADGRYAEAEPATHRLGYSFLGLIFDKHSCSLPTGGLTLEVQTQKEYVDVLCRVGDSHVILIEDKTGTVQHSNQLPRYLLRARASYPDREILPTYVQTLEQSSFEKVEAAGYRIVRRADLIDLFQRYERSGGANAIALDFLRRLRSLDTRYSGFLTEELTEWGWYSWQGFFQQIQCEFEGAAWKYVPNQSGGFLGFAFAKSRVGEIEVLAHLEEEKMCFKISGVSDSGRRRAERTRWHRAIVRAAEQRDLRASKPSRFGSGYSMTVAILTEDYRVGDSQGRLDVEATISRLKKVERLVTHAVTMVGE